MRGVLLVVIVLGGGLAVAEPVAACTLVPSLTPVEPRALVADADAAFVGTLVDIRAKNPPATSSLGPYVFTFRVEERIKGDLPDEVEVVAASGASCGIDGPVGRRTGLILTGAPGAWTSWLGAMHPPETLRRGLRPLPEPGGSAPAAFLAAGHFGEVRTALLDSRGRVLRYGTGRGAVTALSLCPGGEVVTELVRRDQSVFLATRRIRTLELLRERRLVRSGYGDRVHCRNRSGSVALAAVRVDGRKSDVRLLRSTPVGLRTLDSARDLSVAVHGHKAFISRGNGRLTVCDLTTGGRRVAALTGELLRNMSVSPDGSRLVGFTLEELILVDVASGRVETVPRGWSPGNRSVWVGRTRFVAHSSETLETFDRSLRPIGEARAWTAHTTAVTAAASFGVNWNGDLLKSRTGGVVRIGRLFSPAVTILLPLR
jgi:hypothetical protein